MSTNSSALGNLKYYVLWLEIRYVYFSFHVSIEYLQSIHSLKHTESIKLFLSEVLIFKCCINYNIGPFKGRIYY